MLWSSTVSGVVGDYGFGTMTRDLWGPFAGESRMGSYEGWQCNVLVILITVPWTLWVTYLCAEVSRWPIRETCRTQAEMPGHPTWVMLWAQERSQCFQQRQLLGTSCSWAAWSGYSWMAWWHHFFSGEHLLPRWQPGNLEDGLPPSPSLHGETDQKWKDPQLGPQKAKGVCSTNHLHIQTANYQAACNCFQLTCTTCSFCKSISVPSSPLSSPPGVFPLGIQKFEY